MKIKASAIKPGMVICIKRKSEFDDFCLVTATRGKVVVSYTHLDFQYAYGGLLVGSIKGSETVHVILGKKRKRILDRIKRDIFHNLHDVENIIDTLKLIEVMEK